MKYLLFLLLIIPIIGCSGPKNIAYNYGPDPLSEDLINYLLKFQETVISHDPVNLMKLLDPKYIREQHDDFLKGNTEQFIDELFCGYIGRTKESFKCLKLKNITHIDILSIEPEGDRGYRVYYHVSNDQFVIEANWFINILHDSDQKFGLVGAVG